MAREVGTEGKLGGQAEVAGRVRHVAAVDRKRQPAGGQPDHPGARDRRGGHRGDPGRPDPVDLGRGQGEVAELKDNINEMIANLRETTHAQHRAGLAEDQPGQHLPHAPGPARPGHGDPADPVRAGADGDRAARRLLPGRADARRPARAGAGRLATGIRAPQRPARPIRARRGPGRPVRAFERKTIADRPTLRPATSRSDPAWARPRRADIMVLPVLFEDQVLGVIELASLRPFIRPTAPSSTSSTETIGMVLNTIERQHAHGGAARRSRSRWRRSSRSSQEELQQTNDELQEKARLLAEQNREVETQERRGRAGAARPGGEGRAAGLDLQVQVGVPGQHVARAAHAAELPADPQPPAGRERGRAR